MLETDFFSAAEELPTPPSRFCLERGQEEEGREPLSFIWHHCVPGTGLERCIPMSVL